MSHQGKGPSYFNSDFYQNEVFPFLKKAIMSFDDSIPFRGPELFEKNNFKYVFEFEGDYSYFKGREKVFYKREVIFFQDVMGSLIK